MEELDEPEIIVLWKTPLIEIIGNKIFINDILVWKNGELVHRDD